MRYKITIEYLGTNYSGWQRQKNAISVQEVVENVLEKLFQQKIVIEASGRTDKGVHSLGQVAHFDAEKVLKPYAVIMATNSMLPKDIKLTDTEVVDTSFHARFSAKRKTYCYRFYISRFVSPVRHLTHAQIFPNVDVSLMQSAVKDVIGTHDFTGFSATGSHITNNTRTIYDAEITALGDEVTLKITGNGFLYNMVRIIAGTLVYIGKGKLPPDAVKAVLETKNRKLAGKTFPPEGLYLEKVFYPAFSGEELEKETTSELGEPPSKETEPN